MVLAALQLVAGGPKLESQSIFRIAGVFPLNGTMNIKSKQINTFLRYLFRKTEKRCPSFNSPYIWRLC